MINARHIKGTKMRNFNGKVFFMLVVAATAYFLIGCAASPSPYYISHDFTQGNPTKTLICLSNFRPRQQKTEFTCGAACALMVLDYYGENDISEEELSVELDVRTDSNPREDGGFGCSTEALANIFRSRGFSVQASTDRKEPYFATVESFAEFVSGSLKQNSPIMVENVAWGGHWVVIIGYDNMGTDTVCDDVLVFADPYDTSDHKQDGYVIKSFERFYYEWFDAGILHPGITRQQFVRPRLADCRCIMD